MLSLVILKQENVLMLRIKLCKQSLHKHTLIHSHFVYIFHTYFSKRFKFKANNSNLQKNNTHLKQLYEFKNLWKPLL